MFISKKLATAGIAVCLFGGMFGAVRFEDANSLSVYNTLNVEEQRLVDDAQLFAIARLMSSLPTRVSLVPVDIEDSFSKKDSGRSLKLTGKVSYPRYSQFNGYFSQPEVSGADVRFLFSMTINEKVIQYEGVLNEENRRIFEELWVGTEPTREMNVADYHAILTKLYAMSGSAQISAEEREQKTLLVNLLKTGILKVTPVSYFSKLSSWLGYK